MVIIPLAEPRHDCSHYPSPVSLLFCLSHHSLIGPFYCKNGDSVPMATGPMLSRYRCNKTKVPVRKLKVYSYRK